LIIFERDFVGFEREECLECLVMTSPARYWRMQRQMRGPEWGREARIRADKGEWELPIESRYNGRSVKIEYLNMVEEVTGKSRVSQVKVEGVTISLVGSLRDVARGSVLRLALGKEMEGRSGAMAEVVMFLTALHHEQIRRENEWVMSGGRGKLDLVEVRKDPGEVVTDAIGGLADEGMIDEGRAREMLSVVSKLRGVEVVDEEREMVGA